MLYFCFCFCSSSVFDRGEGQAMSCFDTSNPSRSYILAEMHVGVVKGSLIKRISVIQINHWLVEKTNRYQPHYYLFLSQFTQLLLVKHKYLCPKTYMKYARERKTEASSFSSSQLTGYYSILQTHLFLSPFFKYMGI